MKTDIIIPRNFEKKYLLLKKRIGEMEDGKTVGRVVMTGPPGSGKSTSLRMLKKSGYHVTPDISREYLAWRNGTGKKVTREELYSIEMQRKLFYLMAKNELELDPSKFMLMDYGLPCNLAFIKLAGLKIPLEIEKSAVIFKYQKVSIFEPVKLEDDGVRTEDENDQALLFKLLKETYYELGYDPLIVKKDTIENRHKFLINELKNTQKAKF